MILPNTEENPETVNIHVTVTDEEDNPISGATVSIDEISSTTGGQGGCNLPNVPVGIQTVTVTKTGYEEFSDSITVSSTNTEFTLKITEQ